MKKISFLFLFATLTLFVKAEEGMLIPTLLNAFESDMQAMGMEISAQDIYDANNASIKDAIFHFGGGCTSSTISNKGLLLTNHHCGYSQIYSHTTVENNIANNGYWAKDLSEELKNDGLTATRMVKIQDVTDAVLAGTLGLSEADAAQKIRVNIARIKAEELDGTFYEADIKAFNFGNSYFLLVKETFRDVRLVGTPPKSVGKFGGDLDNWVWPRHTGDFAIFRIYADKNNQPADYNANNQPYT
ncbi:MAG TPA: S46 family peptidase, partial [Brumimicrobium sp.]|nr:S46 family peptidase [Brumimicrobium sp.]